MAVSPSDFQQISRTNDVCGLTTNMTNRQCMKKNATPDSEHPSAAVNIGVHMPWKQARVICENTIKANHVTRSMHACLTTVR